MRLSHRPSRARGPRGLQQTDWSRRSGGYVLVKFALLLVPLLLVSGLSVDVGSWYGRISDIQKAADAAALAGVVWLPDEKAAEDYAIEAAERNGFKTGGSITVDVKRAGDRRLRVTITDSKVGSFFFGNLGGRKISLSRTGLAEYLLPVALGSPLAQFGDNGLTGNDQPLSGGQTTAAGGTYPMNLWANIHSPNNNKTEGDAFATACNGGTNCMPNPTNTQYRPGGYLYTIDVPTGVSNMNVQVYDAGFYHRSAETVETGDTRKSGTNVNLKYTFYNRDETELNVNDNKTAQQAGICSPGLFDLDNEELPTTYKMKWASLCRINGTVTPGRYLLRVQSGGTAAFLSRYALRVTADGANKPRLGAYGDMSVFNQVSSGTSSFFLTEVSPVHAGKTLQIRLYDPGETSSGNAYMRVMLPKKLANGTIALRNADNCTGYHDGGTGGSRFVSGTVLSPCQVQTSSSGALYNGNWITLTVPIPADYQCTLGQVNPGCWWKIEYQVTAQTVDNTTWSANVTGDPVHLIEEEAP